MIKNELNLIKGLGPKYEFILNQSGIYNVYDLINIVPKKVTFFSIVDINTINNDQSITISGRIISQTNTNFHNKSLKSLTFSMDINNQIIKVIIFNRIFLRKYLTPGKIIQIFGNYNVKRKELVATEIYLDNFQNLKITYPIKDIASSHIQKFIQSALLINNNIIDDFPNYLVQKYKLLSISDYYKLLHFPNTIEEFNLATRRLKYTTMFEYFLKFHVFSLKALCKRDEPKKYNLELVKKLISKIDFELSIDQKKAVNDIFSDFNKNKYVNRLIQGDVGSGKTIVALISAFATVTANQQVIILAPTEILANQHLTYFRNYLDGFNVSIELITSHTSSIKRKTIISGCKEGSIDILIGTHSLESSDFKFKKLGLVIIDEQHRFGVEIRQNVKKGVDCDSLFFTATPIPRSLALTYFKNLEISEIKSIRSNKKEIKTKYLKYNELDICFDKLDLELKTNHQVYVVVSLIEDDIDDPSGLYDINKTLELFSKRFSDKNIGVLHGKMDKSSTNNTINDFYNKKIDILISTTVIEVGVSVDSASCIVILDAERFGLSTLHQIRGRVGRKDEVGYCFLISKNTDVERLKILEKSTDGFYISSKDLELRGPGSLFSNEQSGICDFKFVNLNNDSKLIECANEDAYDYIVNNRHIKNNQNCSYYNRVMSKINHIKYLN